MTDMFKEKAKDWDMDEMVRQLSSSISKSIIENIELGSDMHVMDFGAGTGLITSKIASHVSKITAVDISQSMLDQLSEKEELKEKVEILCQDITKDATGLEYDLIMSAMAMHHVDDTDNMIKQFSAHLKPGAKVALADLDKEDGSFHPEGIEGVYHDGFEREAFQNKLEANGFKDVNFVTALSVYKNAKTYPVFLALATKA